MGELDKVKIKARDNFSTSKANLLGICVSTPDADELSSDIVLNVLSSCGLEPLMPQELKEKR